MVNLQSQEIAVVGGRLVTNVIVPADELATIQIWPSLINFSFIFRKYLLKGYVEHLIVLQEPK